MKANLLLIALLIPCMALAKETTQCASADGKLLISYEVGQNNSSVSVTYGTIIEKKSLVVADDSGKVFSSSELKVNFGSWTEIGIGELQLITDNKAAGTALKFVSIRHFWTHIEISRIDGTPIANNCGVCLEKISEYVICQRVTEDNDS